MKTKRILLLITMFLFLINSIVLPYTSVFATDTMSEEFKQILNEEGQLVITNTTMLENKLELVRDYLSNYRTDEYYFMLNFYNEVDSTCGVSRINNTDGVPLEEYYDIPVVFEEQFSDEFKQILNEDGKLELPNSSENISGSWVESYVNSFWNENYSFNIAMYNASDDMMMPDYRYLMADDFSKATIIMRNSTGKAEQHVVEMVRITEQSENFKKYLNEDGKLEMNCVKPSSEDDFMIYFDLLIYDEEKNGPGYSELSTDLSSCDFIVDGETHTVDIVYNYDESIKTKLEGLTNNFPTDIEYFKVEDMELINYWANTLHENDVNTLAGYSGELKSYINNYNVKLKVRLGAGWDAPFATDRVGLMILTYDDIAYYANAWLGASAKHIIYVPETTGDTREELIAAAQKRINEYLGNEDIMTVSYAGTAERTYIEYEYEYFREWWEQENPNLTLDEYIAENYPDGIDLSEDFTGIENLNADDDVFKVTVKVGDIEKTYYFFIEKDNSKMITPTYATADMVTDVEISSEDTTIPLDTQVQADKLTSGTEYERIMSILDVEDNATYDLKLYSDSLKDYVTKLEDGTFEVKLPIPEELEGKKLIVYYVDENNKVTEYEVPSPEDGYAVFTTNHFSIYTLAEKAENNIGDPSGDGEINARDAKLAIQCFTGKIALTPEQEKAADVNKDGEVNARDAKLMIQFFTGKITEF